MQPKDADDYLLNLIEKYRQIALKLAAPSASFSFFEQPQINTTTNCVTIEGTVFHTEKIVTRLLRKSEIIMVFAVTIGESLEIRSKHEMQQGNALEGYILDILGSELAEEATEYLHQTIATQLEEQNYRLSNRYSPGYCKWPVNEQHELFSLLDAETGIELNESSLMTPAKSVSGMMGIGREIKNVAYKCRICDDEKCILRERF